MASLLGCSKASISRYERCLLPYTQDVLEAWARAVNCEPAELLTRPPADPEGLWLIFDRIRREERHRAAQILRAFLADEQ
jgi:transcriptional regulator with XRE-family HTH domain